MRERANGHVAGRRLGERRPSVVVEADEHAEELVVRRHELVEDLAGRQRAHAVDHQRRMRDRIEGGEQTRGRAVEPRPHRRGPEAVDRDDVRDNVLDGPTLAACGRPATRRRRRPASSPSIRRRCRRPARTDRRRARRRRGSAVRRNAAQSFTRATVSDSPQPIQNSLPSGSVMVTHRVPFPVRHCGPSPGSTSVAPRSRSRSTSASGVPRCQVDVHAVLRRLRLGNPEEEHVPQPARVGRLEPREVVAFLGDRVPDRRGPEAAPAPADRRNRRSR